MDSETHAHLATVLGNLGAEIHSQTDSAATLRTIVEAAVTIVPGISWAGISFIPGDAISPEPPADDVAQTLNRLQIDLGEGPTRDALRQQHIVAVDDLGTEVRWPLFTAAAISAGVHCLMAFRLFVSGRAVGALTLYGPGPNTFTDDSVLIGRLVAHHAAVALGGSDAVEQLHEAVANRDVVGQAKGILMHRQDLTALQAFSVLTRAAQDTNVELVDVARFIVSEFENDLRNPPPTQQA